MKYSLLFAIRYTCLCNFSGFPLGPYTASRGVQTGTLLKTATSAVRSPCFSFDFFNLTLVLMVSSISLGHIVFYLTTSLSWQLSTTAQASRVDAEVVIAGGYSDNEIATSNKCHVSELLISHQEEAGTRLLSRVHITNAGRHGYKHVFVHCRDTDVVSFLVLYNGDLQIPEIWLVAGEQLKRWYIPIQKILI